MAGVAAACRPADAPRIVDLRSDTVTRPTPAMRAAMAAAEVGDDVFGDDPTVLALQELAAALFGKEAALLTASGTQANLCALMAHAGRGDEVILGNLAHACRYEGGGLAVLGSLQPQPLPQAEDGTMALADIEAAIKPDDPHFARTRLIALENTWNGRPMPEGYVDAVAAIARRHGLGLHLDGARIFNAAVATGRPVRALAAPFDTVQFCLSKGLGAPVGSVLVGSRALVQRAHRIRKMLGGGMRQAGILAAAGLHALDHHVARLAEDHARAARLAEGLLALPQMRVRSAATNIVFAEPVEGGADATRRLLDDLAAQGVLATGLIGLRFVTHLDVDDAGIDRAIAAVRRHFER